MLNTIKEGLFSKRALGAQSSAVALRRLLGPLALVKVVDGSERPQGFTSLDMGFLLPSCRNGCLDFGVMACLRAQKVVGDRSGLFKSDLVLTRKQLCCAVCSLHPLAHRVPCGCPFL